MTNRTVNVIADRRSRRGAPLATAVMASVFVAGCGGDAEPVSSNRGANSQDQNTSVENAFMVPRFVPGSCALQLGDAAQLTFTASNSRPLEDEQLLGIESPAAGVIRLSPPPPVNIAAGATVAVGQPGNSASNQPLSARIDDLRESARPGTSVEVTFRFEKQGDLSMRVPIEACPAQG